MHKPVIAITGASGFIGSCLLQYFHDQQYPVIALVRKPSDNSITEERFFDLQQPVQNNLLTGVDILIHCAYIDAAPHIDAEKINYDGTKALVECANSNQVKKIIFFSSVAAHAQAVSAYGKSKLALESLFNTQKDVVLKCSFVIGNGGLFHRLFTHAVTKKTVPLIHNGRQPLQVIAIDDVLKAIHTIINQSISGLFVLANKQRLTYKLFFKIIARFYNKQLLFIPVPVFLLQLVIFGASLFNIPLPVSKENLLGLQSMQFIDPEDSLQQLQLSPVTLEEKLKDLAAPPA